MIEIWSEKEHLDVLFVMNNLIMHNLMPFNHLIWMTEYLDLSCWWCLLSKIILMRDAYPTSTCLIYIYFTLCSVFWYVIFSYYTRFLTYSWINGHIPCELLIEWSIFICHVHYYIFFCLCHFSFTFKLCHQKYVRYGFHNEIMLDIFGCGLFLFMCVSCIINQKLKYFNFE